VFHARTKSRLESVTTGNKSASLLLSMPGNARLWQGGANPYGMMESKDNGDKPPTAVEWEELSQQVMLDRRKCRRIPLAFPIEVFGFDPTGHLFSEMTTTSDISETGCKFHLIAPVEPGAVVAIKLLSCRKDKSPSKPLLFHIVWVARKADGCTVGAAQLQGANLWPMAFPPNKQASAAP
jgi:hypothetical protein